MGKIKNALHRGAAEAVFQQPAVVPPEGEPYHEEYCSEQSRWQIQKAR